MGCVCLSAGNRSWERLALAAVSTIVVLQFLSDGWCLWSQHFFCKGYDCIEMRISGCKLESMGRKGKK